MPIDPERRGEHVRWLLELAGTPTAAGREWRVGAWVERWVEGRAGLALERDAAGNMVIRARDEPAGSPTVYFTAHMDHPAFVVERVIGPATLECSFRGGVMGAYFEEARVGVHAAGGGVVRGTVARQSTGSGVFPLHLVEMDDTSAGVLPGDIATWDLPASEVLGGLVHAPACDDLAAAAAALGAIDVLLAGGTMPQPVRILLTRAEEIGFVGAIAACRLGTIPRGARVIALENSRSFADSPVGGGPIVRVGDRLSVFSPALTAAVARRAEDLGGPAHPAVTEARPAGSWRWQRKLMPGGACEASVFCALGHEATCLCLPLGNYHNMGDLDAVQAGSHPGPARVAREYISLADFEGLVDLLVAAGESLPAGGSLAERFERLWTERSFVLE